MSEGEISVENDASRDTPVGVSPRTKSLTDRRNGGCPALDGEGEIADEHLGDEDEKAQREATVP